jgi:hypothetical protein
MVLQTLTTSFRIFYVMHIEYWWESQKERDHWEDQDVGGLAISKWILGRQDGIVWIGLICLTIRTSGRLCEYDFEHSGSVKCWDVLEWLHNWWLLKRGSAP